jgi:tetratricopeptide (TPR) repeat protein
MSFSDGVVELRKGEYDNAIRSFTAYLDTGDLTHRARAMYHLARAEYFKENYAAALEWLADLETEFPDMRGRQTAALRGDIAYALGNRIDAVLFWEDAFATAGPQEREVLTPRIESAIEGLDEQEVLELAYLVTLPQIYDMTVDRLPQAHGEEGQPFELPPRDPRGDKPGPVASVDRYEADKATYGAETLEVEAVEESAAGADEDVVMETAVVDAGAAERSAGLPQVACLLPLTGEDRSSGRRALDELRKSFATSAILLVVRDSGSDPAVAENVARQIAIEPRVIGMIGPLRADATTRTAPAVAGSGLPFLPLSAAQGTVSVEQQARDAANALLDAIALGATTRDDMRRALSGANPSDAATVSLDDAEAQNERMGL